MLYQRLLCQFFTKSPGGAAAAVAKPEAIANDADVAKVRKLGIPKGRTRRGKINQPPQLEILMIAFIPLF